MLSRLSCWCTFRSPCSRRKEPTPAGLGTWRPKGSGMRCTSSYRQLISVLRNSKWKFEGHLTNASITWSSRIRMLRRLGRGIRVWQKPCSLWRRYRLCHLRPRYSKWCREQNTFDDLLVGVRPCWCLRGHMWRRTAVFYGSAVLQGATPSESASMECAWGSSCLIPDAFNKGLTAKASKYSNMKLLKRK